jgi:hypothetical protein
MFPVRPESELLVVPVLSVVTELVTLDWLSSTTEPALPDEVLDETLLAFCETLVLEAPLDVTLCARAAVQRVNAANIISRFIDISKSFATETGKH